MSVRFRLIDIKQRAMVVVTNRQIEPPYSKLRVAEYSGGI